MFGTLLQRVKTSVLSLLEETADFATRSARTVIALTARDHRVVGYRVPKEWAALTEGQRGAGSLAAFKRGSRAGFLAEYGGFVCCMARCRVCQSGV